MIHNLKYALKTLFRNKMLIFWTFAFPIILGTFFNMAFSNIENSEKLELIHIAIVEDDNFQKDEILKQAFEKLGESNSEEQIFNIQYETLENSKKLLENGDIIGYLIIEDKQPKVVITANGINETVFKYVVEEIMQTKEVVNKLAEKQIQEEMKQQNTNINIEQIYQEAVKMLNTEETQIKNISKANLSYTMIEFYTLIALACLYGGILGMTAINQNLANMSSTGKRVSVSPTSKAKTVFSSLLAGYIAQITGVLLLFIYTIFVLKVDYGSNLPLIILLSLIGSFAGLSLGVAVATMIKSNENTKTGMMIALTMLGCFLSGMMGITMKYIIDKNIPIINQINPANMITDGFYALYYYDTLDRYFFNIISLLIFSGIMIAIACISLRRQKYDSI